MAPFFNCAAQLLHLFKREEKWTLETHAEQVPEVETAVNFFGYQVAWHCSCCFPWHVPRYHTSFEAVGNEFCNHFVDIEILHNVLLLPTQTYYGIRHAG